jgi:GNAT superfamily N-acetyltransferase
VTDPAGCTYSIRRATAADIPHILRHREGMFRDMAIPCDYEALVAASREWLVDTLASQTYHGWLAEDSGGSVVAGAGLTVLPWPPGPRDVSGRLAFVYNVYTDRAHRRRGLARRLMETIEEWCRAQGIGQIALQASDDGRPLYESLGYKTAVQPLMLR